MGPPPLPNALRFILEALIVRISLFRAIQRTPTHENP
jgi:hypothetical protein